MVGWVFNVVNSDWVVSLETSSLRRLSLRRGTSVDVHTYGGKDRHVGRESVRRRVVLRQCKCPSNRRRQGEASESRVWLRVNVVDVVDSSTLYERGRDKE